MSQYHIECEDWFIEKVIELGLYDIRPTVEIFLDGTKVEDITKKLFATESKST